MFMWFVWPEITKIKSISKESEVVEKKLISMKEKKDKVKNLDQSLGKNSDKENFILNYLPKSRNDEKMIHSVSRLAVAANVSLIGVSIETSGNKEEDLIEDEVPTSGKLFNAKDAGSVELGADGALQTELPVNIKSMIVKISVIGNYDNIKSFLDGMGKMGVMNGVKDVDISVETQGTDDNPVNPEMLTADITGNFYYLKEMCAKNNYNLTILNSSEFDFSQFEKIKQHVSQDFSTLEIGERGNRNPFVAF